MIGLLYGIGAVMLLWWLSRLFASANPKAMARLVRQVGGFAALAAAAVLAFRGRIDMAFLLGGAGAWLLGWKSLGLPGFPSFARSSTPKPGGTSRVRSVFLDMSLDHDSGALTGQVVAGRFAGRALDSLSPADLRDLGAECAAGDPDGARLLEAYLDRRFPGWRDDVQGHADAGAGRHPQSGAMTEEEAYQILGLQPGATLDEVRLAHRTLMKRLHPDQGGTTWLAARVNEAKEVLSRRHR